jgi:hypothetical protein
MFHFAPGGPANRSSKIKSANASPGGTIGLASAMGFGLENFQGAQSFATARPVSS